MVLNHQLLWRSLNIYQKGALRYLDIIREVRGANLTINQNVWGNATVNDLIQDAEKALNVLT